MQKVRLGYLKSEGQFMKDNLGAADPGGRQGMTTDTHTMKAGSRLHSGALCRTEKMELAENVSCLGLVVGLQS